MKKANKYFEEYWVSKTGKPLDEATEYFMSYAIDAIKQAQLDAIEETVKLCAESAKIKSVEKPLSSIGYSQSWQVNRQSILDCADTLKKELE